jgi:hypothetical protein
MLVEIDVSKLGVLVFIKFIKKERIEITDLNKN